MGSLLIGLAIAVTWVLAAWIGYRLGWQSAFSLVIKKLEQFAKQKDEEEHKESQGAWQKKLADAIAAKEGRTDRVPPKSD